MYKHANILIPTITEFKCLDYKAERHVKDVNHDFLELEPDGGPNFVQTPAIRTDDLQVASKTEFRASMIPIFLRNAAKDSNWCEFLEWMRGLKKNGYLHAAAKLKNEHKPNLQDMVRSNPWIRSHVFVLVEVDPKNPGPDEKEPLEQLRALDVPIVSHNQYADDLVRVAEGSESEADKAAIAKIILHSSQIEQPEKLAWLQLTENYSGLKEAECVYARPQPFEKERSLRDSFVQIVSGLGVFKQNDPTPFLHLFIHDEEHDGDNLSVLFSELKGDKAELVADLVSQQIPFGLVIKRAVEECIAEHDVKNLINSALISSGYVEDNGNQTVWVSRLSLSDENEITNYYLVQLVDADDEKLGIGSQFLHGVRNHEN